MAVSLIKKLSTAELAYKNLNGIFCIYKPPDMDLYDIIDQLKTNLTDGINKLPSRPVEKIVKIDEFNDKPTLAFNYADTVQALGPRYIKKDFDFRFIHPIAKHDSGVQLGSINDGERLLAILDKMRLMRVYEIKGRLGVSTDDFTPHGRLVHRTSYSHVSRSRMDRLMASVQATYQREMLKHFGIDLQSQDAYDMISKGLVRPMNTITPPQIYSIRCIEFDRPLFKLEVHTINESTLFLRNLIHDIGVRLKALAICVQIRRVRDGFAGVDSSLAYNEWELENLKNNSLELTNLANDFVKKNNKTILIDNSNNLELNNK